MKISTHITKNSFHKIYEHSYHKKLISPTHMSTHITKNSFHKYIWVLISQISHITMKMCAHITKYQHVHFNMSNCKWNECSYHLKKLYFWQKFPCSHHLMWLISSDMSAHITWIWARGPKCALKLQLKVLRVPIKFKIFTLEILFWDCFS